MMQLEEIVLETRIGFDRDIGLWIWQARGPAIGATEWGTHGPYKTEQQAVRAVRQFERRVARKYRLKMIPVPVPSSLH